MLAFLQGADCSMKLDEVNKLREIIKNLTSVKLNFAEIRKEMDRFSECECLNGRKPEHMPKISEIVELQVNSARYEFQQKLDDGVLSTNKNRKDAKQRIRNKFDRTVDYTKVSGRNVTLYYSLKLWFS